MVLEDQLAQAFVNKGLAAELGALKPSQRPDLCDFVCNGAFAGAGRLKVSPTDLANEIVASLSNASAKIEVVGKGFINVTMSDEWIMGKMLTQIAPEPNNQLVYMDFGGPNVAKPMHVGHMRSLVIGDALSNIAKYLGYTVVKDIHLGDWGLQMGMLLAQISDNESFPADVAELGAVYRAAAARAKEDDSFHERSQQLTQALQSGDSLAWRTWQQMVQLTVDSVKQDLHYLGIDFDLWMGESDSSPVLDATIAKLQNVLESEGALVVEGDPPLILKNSAGAWLYGATDLGTIDIRAAEKPDEMVYVVDQRQALHFKQVFDAARALTDAKLTHVGFGTVNGPDGKPFKTREGETPLLSDLLQDAHTKAFARNKDPIIAHHVAVAGLKFSDLRCKRTTDYVFDLDRSLGHEGHTGVYLLYAITRIYGIQGKAMVYPTEPVLDTVEKRQLALTLIDFDRVVQAAWQSKMPHFVCEHLLTLASQFSAFYAQENISQNSENLSLALKVRDQLELGLSLLGIKSVQVM